MKKNIIFILMIIFSIHLGFSDIVNTGNDESIVTDTGIALYEEKFTTDGIAIDNNDIEKENFNDFDINSVTLYRTRDEAEAACSSIISQTDFELKCIQTKYRETTQNRKDNYYSALVNVRDVTKEYIVEIYKCSKYDWSSIPIISHPQTGEPVYDYPNDFDIKTLPCLERNSDKIEGYICNHETRMEEDKSTREFCGYAETLEDLKCSEIGTPHCIPNNKPKECECLFENGYIEKEIHDCSEYSEESSIVYESEIYTQHRTCEGCYWNMWRGDRHDDNYCKILECPSGSAPISTPFGDICFPYPTKNIGSEKSKGNKNLVSFCGINEEGKSMNVKASCEGDWTVDPCNWESSCSTGWKYEQTEIYSGCSHTCSNINDDNNIGERPNVINIRSETTEGTNSRVILCGRRDGVSMSGIATCSGEWSVDPCNWESSCSTGWKYNENDYKKNACIATCQTSTLTSINIGSQTSSGNNNIVSFCGSKGTGKALCEGHWSVNPMAWTSSCDTGWVYDAKDYGKDC